MATIKHDITNENIFEKFIEDINIHYSVHKHLIEVNEEIFYSDLSQWFNTFINSYLKEEIKAVDFYKVFTTWCTDCGEGSKTMSKSMNKFGMEIKKQKCVSTQRKGAGIYYKLTI